MKKIKEFFELLLGVIFLAIIGYYFFGDFPNQWIWIGLIIIVASGIYISLRENKNSII